MPTEILYETIFRLKLIVLCVHRAIGISYHGLVGILLLILMLLFCIGSKPIIISASKVIVAIASFLADHVFEVQ